MSDRIASKYKNNVIATGKRHVYSRLLDYFSMFVVTYLVFTIFYAIGSRLPVMDNISRGLIKQNLVIAEYIDSTHLQRLNESHSSLLSIDDGAEKYVLNVCKTSAYVHEVKFPVKQDDGTYVDTDVAIEETFANEATSYPLDDLSYYFKSFKKNDESLNNYVIDGVDYSDDIDTFMYQKIMKIDETKYVASDDTDLLARGNGISHFVVLTSEETTSLLNYYREDSTGASTFNHVYNSFIRGAQNGIKDVEKHSATYKKLITDYNLIYQKLTFGIFIIYLLSYTFAFLLMMGVMRLIAKEWITLGQKVLSLSMSDTHEFEPTWWQITLYNLVNYVLFFSSSSIAFYFMGIIGVFSLSIIGKFTVLALLIAILTLNIISLFMPLFNKRHFDLNTLMVRLLVKDTKEFEGPVGMDDISDQVEAENGTSQQ